MLNKYVLAPAILSLAGLLAGADTASAAPRGGHSGGHNHGGSWGSFGLGYGLGYLSGSGYGYGYYGRGYYSPYYYDSYSYPSYYTVPSYQSNYYTPGPDASIQPAAFAPEPSAITNTAPVNNAARVRVLLPDPQARVWFDGTATTQTGNERFFHTPALSPGATFNYQVRAAWMQNGREVTRDRTVSVMGGQMAVVDFSQASSEALPAPLAK